MFQQSRHSRCENLRLLIFFMLVLPCFAQMPVPGNADPAQAVTPNTSVPAPQVQFGTTGRLSAGDLIEQAPRLNASHGVSDNRLPPPLQHIIANRMHRDLRVGKDLVARKQDPAKPLILTEIGEVVGGYRRHRPASGRTA